MEPTHAPATILVNIDLSDVERATSFYCEAFGLRVGRRFGEAAVELTGSSSSIYVLARAEGSVATDHSAQRRDYGRHFGHGFCLIEFLGRGYDEIGQSPEGGQ